MTTAALPYGSRPRMTEIARPKIGRTAVNAVDVIAGFANVVRPLALTGGILILAVAWPSTAKADPQAPFTDVGNGGNGPVSSTIGEVGTSICPLLVQPASQVASTATQMSGNGGLAPPIAGWVAGAAIQSQCPAFMTALSNGDLSVLGNAANMLGAASPALPAVTNPLLVPGITP